MFYVSISSQAATSLHPQSRIHRKTSSPYWESSTLTVPGKRHWASHALSAKKVAMPLGPRLAEMLCCWACHSIWSDEYRCNYVVDVAEGVCGKAHRGDWLEGDCLRHDGQSDLQGGTCRDAGASEAVLSHRVSVWSSRHCQRHSDRHTSLIP